MASTAGKEKLAGFLPNQAEIIDETDVYEDVNHRVLRRGGARADVATFLTM